MPLALTDIDEKWVASLCPGVEIRSFQLSELRGQGVISRYQSSTDDSIVGHRLLTIQSDREHRFVIKSKVPGRVIRQRLEETYRRFDPRLADLSRTLSPSILDQCHTRELRIYQIDRPSFRAITPEIARVWLDERSQIYVVVMEHLADVRHASTLDNLDAWTPQDIDCALSQMARFHGELLGKVSPIDPPPWLVPFHQLNNAPLLEYEAALLRYNAETFPELFDRKRIQQIETLLASAETRHRAITARPLTLIHGDFTPRNICLKSDRLCAYDWELAQVHLPQRDVVELLCYLLRPSQRWNLHLERYRTCLQLAYGKRIEPADFKYDLAMALAEFCTFKLLVQGITHQLLKNRTYFERLVANAFAGLDAFASEGLT